MLEVENLIYDYPEEGGRTVRGLTLPSFQMDDGEAWGVEGPCGRASWPRCSLWETAPWAG